ncbi:hypothetical protein C2E20_5080 [Micractinium conductrix]|uniref:FHA domain-containing protein n=1 Tax=Micractinium conductrix TaxID=554055 RepID=A0A2P6VBY8_9CHLO|nr:hypothetical protein C2E20_5080 [Micractinium conductrix]|eukprot:PSC71612.1 hypothetical protein C2E20_5080 [Micractinium conductrix]
MEGNQQGWAFSGDQHAAQALHDALDAQQELLEAALARAGEAEQRAAAAEQRAAAAAAAEAAQRRAVAAAEQRAADAEARAVAAEHRAAAAEEHAIKAEAQTATARRQRNEASVRLEGLLQSMAALASQYKEGPSMPLSQQQQQQQQHRQPAHPPPPPYPPAAAPWLLHSPHTPPPVQHDWEQRPAPAGTSREWGGSRTLSRAQPVAAAAGGGGSGSGKAPPVALTLPDGSSVAMPQAAIVVGSGADAGLQLPASPNLAPAHARLEFKSGRLFCTALAADPDALLAPTHCWLDGVELRPGVNYLVAPGAQLAVGTQGTTIACRFEEGGSSAMAEMMMQGLVASASKEVKEKLGGM